METPPQWLRITHDNPNTPEPVLTDAMRLRHHASAICGLSKWLSLIILVGFPLPAMPALGEDTTSIARDSAAMGATLQISETEHYSVHELRTPAGTTVRQYAVPSGSVFAITWEGPLVPDLRQILGRYFARYAATAATAQSGRRQVSVREPDFVVEASGQMRAFYGKAHLPQLLPHGVRADELQ